MRKFTEDSPKGTDHERR